MYLADYHTHTQFSPDAHDPMTVMAQAALDAGMDEICFTDHVEPLTWGSNELRPPYDWSALTEDFANVQAALGDRIHLRLGMEMGDAQKAPAHMKKLLEDAPQFDFIIGSVHLLSERFGSEDLYLYTPKDQAEAQTALGDYLEEVLALAKLGGFTVLGHLTLPLRYFNEMRGLHTSFDPYEAEIREILKTLIENGRGIELNVNRGNTPLPDAKWLRIYRELGGELITLGTDAHSPEHVGRFHLDGIAPARRGVPQIEVTFDIDANGIVNVSAKDLGTGTEQHITITSSSNMSKDDIEKAVKEAEQYAAQDKKMKEDVETRNQADQMVYQSEKTLNEMGDKIPAEDKSKVQTGIDKLKEALKGTDTAAIKTATDELTQDFYAVSEKLYQQANPQGAQGGAQTGPDMGGQQAGGAQDGQYYDADYKVVDDDDQNKK